MVWIHIAWTILLLVAFVAVVAWAWSRRRRESFEEAANIPLKDDDH